MNLSKSFTQYNSAGHPISSLSIEVDYDWVSDDVTRIVSVGVLDYHTGRVVDITKQMVDLFDISLDLVIKNINWPEVYIETKEQQEVDCYE